MRERPADITRPVASDYRAIARLHSASITEGFLSTLGLPFLTELYRGINDAPQSGVLVARDQNTVLGFAAYTACLSACYRNILARHFAPIAISLLPNVLNPAIYRKCIETLMYPLRASREAAAQSRPGTPRAELLSIAVGDKARGHGLGKKLVDAVDAKFGQLGITEYVVVTYGLDLRSNCFYNKCGFQLVGSFTNHGKPMNEYQRQLQPARRP